MKILLLPAWYPCFFFKRQADLVSEDFEIKVLLGSMNCVGKKKAIKNSLKKKQTSYVESHIDYMKLSYQYVNHLPTFLNELQINEITKKIGNLIINLFDGEKPNLIHIQSISDTAVFVCKWAKENGIRVILTEHILFVRHEITVFSKMREQVYEAVDEVLCVSNYVYRNLLTSGFKMQKVSVVGNFVDDRFVPDNLSQIKKNKKILFVANHYHDKGLDTLFSVVEKLQKNKQKIVVDIAGLDSRSKYNEILTVIEEMDRRGITSEINLLGTVDSEKLLRMYSYYSMLLSTSISETFGLAVAEAIAYGTKVVCTDSGGVRDFVRENNGVVVGIKDVDGICDAVNRIFDSSTMSYIESSVIRDKYGFFSFKKVLTEKYQSE